MKNPQAEENHSDTHLRRLLLHQRRCALPAAVLFVQIRKQEKTNSNKNRTFLSNILSSDNYYDIFFN